jgi:tRNA pseudouridine38-40 synthase
MRNFLVNVQFNGKNYKGFQINGTQNTVELQIETALFKLFGEKITICGCSRTDAGVSAKEYYFTFLSDTKLPADRVAFKLNRFLPNDIQCQKSSEVPQNFKLRENIKAKTYEYAIYDGEHAKPLLNRFSVFVCGNLNEQNMQKCANLLVGTHNFKSFCNQNAETQSYVRTIENIKIVRTENLIKIYVTGDGFLYNMVRIIAGTLVECGLGKLNEDDIKNLFKVQDRSKNPAKTMNAKGLTLFEVKLK